MNTAARLANSNELPVTERNGAIWKLDPAERDLDANVISLTPEQNIGAHDGPEIDVVLHVLSGSGELISNQEHIELVPGDIIYLPARSPREFIAGPSGLAYFSVHQRKHTTGLMPSRRDI